MNTKSKYKYKETVITSGELSRAGLAQVTAQTKDDISFELSIETRGKKKVGTADTGGEREGWIWVTAGVRVEARGPRGADGKRITEIARRAVTRVMGTSPVVMVAIVSGLITLNWDGESTMNEDEIAQGLVRELGEMSYSASTETPRTIRFPASELVWFCRVCLEGPWIEDGPAKMHIQTNPSHGIGHVRPGVLERIKKDREESAYMGERELVQGATGPQLSKTGHGRGDFCAQCHQSILSEESYSCRCPWCDRNFCTRHVKPKLTVAEPDGHYCPDSRVLTEEERHEHLERQLEEMQRELDESKSSVASNGGIASMPRSRGIKKGGLRGLFNRCPRGGRHEWGGWTIYLPGPTKSNVREMVRSCRKCGESERKVE